MSYFAAIGFRYSLPIVSQVQYPGISTQVGGMSNSYPTEISLQSPFKKFEL